MTVQLIGARELRARLEAIKPSPDLMRNFALAAVAAQKVLVPRRTGNLGRSIRIGAVTPTYAETVAGASYAAFVELGTKAHDIVPRRARTLAWPADKASSTLAGRVRKGGRVRFAKRVRHPGTRPKPFMLPGAETALRTLGIKAIIDAWDDAA